MTAPPGEVTGQDMRDAVAGMAEAAQTAQRMCGQLINAVIFLGVVNLILMIALILMATR